MSEERTTRTAYDDLRRELREQEVFGSIGAVLSWDQETMLPPLGTPLRAEQMAVISQLIHERRTSERFGDLLGASEQDPELRGDPLAEPNLREIRRGYDRAVRLPTGLVRALAETTTHAQQAWRQARERSDFAHFSPWLEKIVGLVREKADCLGGAEVGDPYDALLDQFEPGARTAEIEEVFRDLRVRLTPLIQEIASASRHPSDAIQRVEIPIPAQQAFNAEIARRIGFDFEAGRLDTSTHPFCQGIGPGDTRITTRYARDGFPEALSSTLHEAGHALYEQNLPKEAYLGQPLSEPVSLGIHESQSRLWENLVGRSRPFWEWALPLAKQTLAGRIDEFDVEDAYGAVNVVRPNLIRVESDEATYNLHIMLRFDLERAMLSGDLTIADLPAAWNERIRSDLGLDVPDDRRGCLQDVHWSMGAIGYFPTYTLGNLYAAQFWVEIRNRLPDLEEQLGRGEFEPLLGWLREEIHRHGRRYTAPELCQRLTSGPLTALPFMSYLEGKLRPVYGL